LKDPKPIFSLEEFKKKRKADWQPVKKVDSQ